MRYLLVCQSLGAEMRCMATWLAGRKDCKVILAMDRWQEDANLPGVERVVLKKAEKCAPPESLAACMGIFMRKAEKAAYSLQALAGDGLRPDIILASASNGAAFGLREIFPQACLVNYLETAYPASRIEADARSLLQSMQIIRADLAFAFSEGRRKALPEALWRRVRLAPLAVDTAYFRPGENGGAKNGRLLIFWLKALNPPDFGRWLTEICQLLNRRENLSAVIFAPNMRILHAAEEFLAAAPRELAARIELKSFPCRSVRKEIFTQADLIISPSREINLDLLEAMACGVPAMTAAKAPGLEAGLNCLKLPSRNVAEAIGEILAKGQGLANIGAAGRRYAQQYHALDVVVPAHMENILSLREHGK